MSIIDKNNKNNFDHQKKQKASMECFQTKLSTKECKNQLDNLISTQRSKQENKLHKGMYNGLEEISCLLSLAEYYNASHLKWTGDHTQDNSFDGIIYFNEKNEQKIEVSRALDEEFTKDMNRKGYADRDIDDESIEFIGDRIVKILKKKNKQKYKDCWLAIAYNLLIEGEITYLRNTKFEKIKSENKELLTSIRNIFNKIIFVSEEKIMKTSNGDLKPFEWSF